VILPLSYISYACDIKKEIPAQIGENLGEYLVENIKEVIAHNVVKGFLNLVIADQGVSSIF
jgi:arginyl-tRNA synthetase